MIALALQEVTSKRPEFPSGLQTVRSQRIVRAMVFVELTPFIAFRAEHWNDEDLRRLQEFLLATPEAGDVIPGSSGLRKLRWSAQGRGKRGGARVIYYRHVPEERIYLIYAYVKSAQADLTREQIRTLAQLMKDIKNG